MSLLLESLAAKEEALEKAYRLDEASCVETLIAALDGFHAKEAAIQARAHVLIEKVRAHAVRKTGIDAFLYEYDLSSEEGATLMCLAEAFLRIPDTATLDALIKDKLTAPDWGARLGQSESTFVNAATWGLMLTGKVLSPAEKDASYLSEIFKKLVGRVGEPIIRQAIKQGMKILSEQFVLGRTIQEGLKRAEKSEARGYRHSYDMLGEAAKTREDAARYFEAYRQAIIAIGGACHSTIPAENPGISVKLSALHPRYHLLNIDRVFEELLPQVIDLALLARSYHMGLTIDAEESERLSLSLKLIEAVLLDPRLSNWNGFGLAVQAYQKRAPYVIDFLVDCARRSGKQIMVRLVKGAYWDTEIKRAQELGMKEYPVFTRKHHTDLSYLVCAKKMIAAGNLFFSQFATHNAYTIAAVMEMMGNRRDYEFQCLHGMGHGLYDHIVGESGFGLPARVYAPIGSHEDLLSYLVRRLLENGANTSFVNRIIDREMPIESLLVSPVEKTQTESSKAHPGIPLPEMIYGPERLNAAGFDLSDRLALQTWLQALEAKQDYLYECHPIINGEMFALGEGRTLYHPADRKKSLGIVYEVTSTQAEAALAIADSAFDAWANTPVAERAACLSRAADLLEQDYFDYMILLIQEGGKTFSDAVAELREAIDFCRYYAKEAIRLFSEPMVLPGPTGEHNELRLHGRGTILCISPWNFPLAIFMGQVTAALVAGNTVIAKPARQTPFVAARAIACLHEAGIPKNVLQFLPGSGQVIGDALLPDARIKGVVFTGSTSTAQHIAQQLAARPGAIVPLIAETGGQNAMIVDSSALPEQVVQDVLLSAFGSAGQRCSALRVLFLQEEVADKVLKMLCGAMAELQVNDPSVPSTDVGPVIDQAAQKSLQAHVDALQNEAALLYQIPLSPQLKTKGNFFAPCVFELQSLSQLTEEHFGPILHVIRYARNDLDKVLADIRATYYGLTLGIHTRLDSVVDYIVQRVAVGNIYVNRSMIGAVVGVQPFGGEGLSGTGPKAGGPHYLLRLCTERTITINTTATGGNTDLMSLAV
jgi:RHH-type proline utilization regulon transcriptional repressor/proline dehydrogenase/delta 1-pyrroline-5-carboxylate dehydrogenase